MALLRVAAILMFLTSRVTSDGQVTSGLERRLSFKSEFDVRCELIDYDNDSRRSLRTSIIRRKDQLQGLCEEVLHGRRNQYT
ncbi:hypothetical protein EB796_001032 [Bugula neritina]|uniref:Secreted protein n=1 Tax=Bugula neritina TaxID=10212 RepID=A0A7J7KR27_BUGNE|nr:hypothetical protein EB796_001032 [Bugula neritina]